MISGNDLIQAGWPQGPLVGLALKAAGDLPGSDSDILELLARVRANPAGFDVRGHTLAPLANALLALAAQQAQVIRDTPLAAPVWGEALIDPRAVQQLSNAMRLPVTVAGALMPDAHVGYGIPIGGVVALEGAVAPYMVGVDIACRMMMSLYRVAPDEVFGNDTHRGALKTVMREETRFGVGAAFGKGERRQHAVLDDPAWNTTPLLQGLRDKAAAQLGTSGSGNHFIDAGALTLGVAGAQALAIPPGSYLALMTHSGSRGVGAKIADHYAKVARSLSRLPGELRHLAWLSLASEAGKEYWLSMSLAGQFASANHHTIHQAVSERLGLEPMVSLENHHNFAWQEPWQGREVVVHRKGATPAQRGVVGIIPGSQGHPSFVVRGLGNPASLNSASHGAGRVMSRTEAKKTLSAEAREQWLEAHSVELMGGGLDEAPQAYKDIEQVLALQSDLVEPLATFAPRLVLMSDDPRAED